MATKLWNLNVWGERHWISTRGSFVASGWLIFALFVPEWWIIYLAGIAFGANLMMWLIAIFWK